MQLAAEPEASSARDIDVNQLAATTATGEATFVVAAKKSGRQVPLQGVMPFAPGLVGRNTRFQLKSNGQAIPCQVTPLAVWPDGKSLQTVLVEFSGDVQAEGRQTLTLAYAPGESANHPCLQCKRTTLSMSASEMACACLSRLAAPGFGKNLH